MIEPEVVDGFLRLFAAVAATGLGLGLLTIAAAILGVVIRMKWLSRRPSTTQGKEPFR
ncbi:hypothetical protein [Glycomyces arizonensis]|uniref:hypothetical protein n=1 Tax=Glycomyces arizonensis TaxID=256035 RepID=UPI000410BF17|nr:hypothetical protein [Glycomyces arizonensis]